MECWKTKVFKTKWAMDCFIIPRQHTHQMVEIFVDNGYGIEYRRLKRIH